MKRLQIILLLALSIGVFSIRCRTCENPVSGDGDGGPDAGPIAIVGGILIDGTGSEPIPDAVIIVRDGYIEALGPSAGIETPEDARIIDVGGAHVLPGFINAHVHSGYSESNLKRWAESGVTTVRDLGNFKDSPEQAFSTRNSLLRDNRNARLVAAGPMVTAVGGYGSYPVDSPSDARDKIAGLIDAGADLIKIAIEDNLQGRRWPMLGIDEIRAIVQTAHQRNRKVCAHISRPPHLDLAIRTGVDDVAHMVISRLPDSLISSVVEKDMYWVPTLELWKGVSDYHDLDWDEIAKDNLRRFVRAGGKVALGTDYDGYFIPFDLGMPMVEMRLMQEAGMTPTEIVTTATKHAAHVCDLGSDLGTIEAGKIADIITVNGNPADDIEVLLNVQMVIHNGEIIVDKTVR